MAELADALDSGSSDHYDSCRFKSCFPHQSLENDMFSRLFLCVESSKKEWLNVKCRVRSGGKHKGSEASEDESNAL